MKSTWKSLETQICTALQRITAPFEAVPVPLSAKPRAASPGVAHEATQCAAASQLAMGPMGNSCKGKQNRYELYVYKYDTISKNTHVH